MAALAALLPVMLPAQSPALSVKGVPSGYMLIEGDMLVRIPPGGAKGVFDYSWPVDYWPSAGPGEPHVIPYELSPSLDATMRVTVLGAIKTLESVANVKWSPRNGNFDYVYIQPSLTVNNSMVGRQGGLQVINIVDWSLFIIVHEMIHTLGFYHEQSRGDRGSYVQVIRANFNGDDEHFEANFGFHGAWWGPYDFDSVMHYDGCAFSTCGLCMTGCETIRVLPPNEAWQNLIGQRTHLSYWDKRILSFLYPYSDWRFVQADTQSPLEMQRGEFLNPFASLPAALADVPAGGTIWFTSQGGTFVNPGTYRKPMTLKSGWSNVTIR